MKRPLVLIVQVVKYKNTSLVVNPNITKNIYISLLNISFATIYEPNIPIIPHNIPNNKIDISIDKDVLKQYSNVELKVAHAEKIPFDDNTFDITTCNLVLMWMKNPQKVVDEMARVTKIGGIVLASLEPDYGGKLHYPENPKVDPIFAGDAIREKGGDPHIGRKLRYLFVKAGLKTEVGTGNNRIWSCKEDKD